MNQVPHITIEQAKAIWSMLAVQKHHAANILIDKANADQEQPLITAEEARKLGVGKAEFQAGDGEWIVCKPTCQVRNDDTGKTETMTREKAKLLQAETMDICDWLNCGLSAPQNMLFAFDAIGIYTYKLKANLVKLDGELMTREAAIVKWESRKDTCDCYVSTESRPMWEATKQPSFSRHNDFGFCEYQIRAKPLKQVSWNDVPVGVAVRDMVNNVTWLYQGFDHASDVLLTNQKNMPFGMRWDASQNLELAAASEQPWIAVQDGETCHGIALDLATKGLVVQKHERDEKYRITGLAEGHELK